MPGDLPPYLASLYEVPLLTRKQEAFLFRKMNYLKNKAGRLRAKLDPARPKRGLMDQIEHFYDEAVSTKNQIIRAKLAPGGLDRQAPHRSDADDFFSWSATAICR